MSFDFVLYSMGLLVKTQR